MVATASDTETILTSVIDLVESSGEGTYALSSIKLLDALKALPDQPITIEINENSLEVTIYYQHGKYKFVAQDASVYPVLKKVDQAVGSLVLPASVLLRGINITYFASGDDSMRPVMSTMVMDVAPDCITFVASDAHKLVRMKNMSVKGDSPAILLIPKKPTNILRSLLPKESGEVSIQYDGLNLFFGMSDYQMICRLVEGRYPNYNAVIPANNPYKIVIDRIAFLNALKRVSIFANQSTSLVKLAITENQIQLTSQDIDFSTSAEETVSCQYEGESLIIGFKAEFLIDIVSNLETEDIVIKLADPSRAGLFLPVENEPEEDLIMLLMPMLLND